MLNEPVVKLAARPLVKELTAGEKARWDAFVLGCEKATFFHRFGWKTILEDEFGHETRFFYAERDGRICGVLPLAIMRSALFGTAVISLPFCVYGGAACEDADAQAALEARAIDLAEEAAVGHLELRDLHRTLPEALERAWLGKDLYYTFRKEIQDDPEANLLAIPRKQRAMVRKGEKAHLGFARSEVDEFFKLYADNVRRHGTPAFAKRYFSRLQSVFANDCVIHVVRDAQGKSISGVLSFRHRTEILPYYAGDLVSARELAANDFKYWRLMVEASAHGARLFDFGRSKLDTGPFHFKKNWGFTPQPLAYRYRLIRAATLPEHNPLNPKYRAFIAAWKRLPLGIANRLGPWVVRGLG